jgi:hypothetical protein
MKEESGASKIGHNLWKRDINIFGFLLSTYLRERTKKY